MTRTTAVVLAAVTALSACAITRASSSDMGSGLALAPRPGNCTIRVFSTHKPEPDSYVEIASLQVSGNIFAGEGAIHGRLKREACARGADALIMRVEADPGWSNTARAVAIVFTAPTLPPGTPAP